MISIYSVLQQEIIARPPYNIFLVIVYIYTELILTLF